MPRRKARRKRTESLTQKLEAIIVRIPITTNTLTAALLLIQQLIELARVVKVPLQIEKVAPMEIQKPTPPSQIEQVTAETKIPTETLAEEEK